MPGFWRTVAIVAALYFLCCCVWLYEEHKRKGHD